MIRVFLDEDIVVTVNNVKASSTIKSCIYKHWGRSKAKHLYSNRDKVLPWAFDDIYWEGRIDLFMVRVGQNDPIGQR
jgi:hypothetical protein